MIKEPAQVLAKSVPFITGYELGKAKPSIAKEIVDFTERENKEDVLAFFSSWRKHVASKVSDDPIYQELITNMLETVEIDFKFKPPAEQERIIKETIEKFTRGLKAGIR